MIQQLVVLVVISAQRWYIKSEMREKKKKKEDVKMRMDLLDASVYFLFLYVLSYKNNE